MTDGTTGRPTGRLTGKVAVVTGAGRGIGRAYALALAAEGARVVVDDTGVDVDGDGPRRPEPAAEVAAEIVAAGGEAIASIADVSDFTEARGLMDTAVEAFGRLDILVANAGVIRPVWLHQAGERDWNAVLAAHATGTFNSARHASEKMIAGGEGGTIIAVGTNSTEVYFPRIAAYRSAKAAIATTAIYLAEELAEYGITVNAIMPGGTATRMAEAFFAGLDERMEKFLANLEARQTGSAEQTAAAPESVPHLGVYLATADGRHITGKVFGITGNGFSVIEQPAARVTVDNGADQWTHEELDARLQKVPELARPE